VTRFVVDASVAVKWLVPESHADAARRILSPNHELLAPDLIWAEVGNVIWKKWRQGEFPGDAAGELLQDFRRYPLQTFGSRALMSAAWDLAERYSRSFYDSLYLALAASVECSLVTADLKLYNRLKASPFAERLVWVENAP
jgi:predicted nucleic acid-binding protein